MTEYLKLVVMCGLGMFFGYSMGHDAGRAERPLGLPGTLVEKTHPIPGQDAVFHCQETPPEGIKVGEATVRGIVSCVSTPFRSDDE